MTQSRLEQYFSTSRKPFVPSPGLDFFNLPFSVRKMVYEYTELVNNTIDLNYANLDIYPRDAYPDKLYSCRTHCNHDLTYMHKRLDVTESDDIWEFDEEEVYPGQRRNHLCACSIRPWYSLLLTSKWIHQEIEAIVYKGNTFQVCLGGPYGFKRLWLMSERAISNLTSLTVRLQIPQSDIPSGQGWGDPAPPTPIDLLSRSGALVLKVWLALLEKLSRAATPRKLWLSVIFSAHSIEDVKTILKPMETLQALRHCSICVNIIPKSARSKPVSKSQYASGSSRN